MPQNFSSLWQTLCCAEFRVKFNIGDINMVQKSNKQSNEIKVCFTAYRPTITKNDVDDLVSFIVIVAQEGFRSIKVA